jgi:hypothetical protein
MSGLAELVSLPDLVEGEPLRYRQREPAGLGQVAYFLQGVYGTLAGVINDRDHVLGSVRELHERRQRASSRGVESGVDAVRRELSDEGGVRGPGLSVACASFPNAQRTSSSETRSAARRGWRGELWP